MSRDDQPRMFTRFNAGINAARIEYARTLAELEAGACGTPGGHRWHTAHDEPACDACTAALSDQNRKRYAKRKER